MPASTGSTSMVSNPSRVPRHRSSDNIAKLKRMNSSLQKSYHKGTGIHDTAFVPASATTKEATSTLSPARDKYWYGSPNHGSPKEGFPARNLPRNRTSEYNEKFVEWELPDRRSASPEPRRTSLNNFMVDMNASNWKSEQKQSFTNKTSERQAEKERAAGVSTRGDANKHPASFAWNVNQSGFELDRKEPKTSKGQALHHGDEENESEHRISEHNVQFKWPAASERIIRTYDEKKFNPMAMDHVASNPHTWRSEYNAQNASVRKNHEAEVTEMQPTAGKTVTKDNLDIPAFYAWEDELKNEKVKAEVKDAHYPSNYHMGNTEYKAKFVEWPVEHDEAVERNAHENNASHIFPPGTENAYADLRKKSLYKENFHEFSDRELANTSKIVSPQKDEKPMSFAWNLVDQENVPNQASPTRKARTNPQAESEYTRKYNWPPLAAYPSSPLKKAADVSTEEIANTLKYAGLPHNDHPDRHLATEYDAMYQDYIAANQFVPSSPSRHMENRPAQFAWPLMDNLPVPLEDDAKVKPRRVLDHDPILSEHTSKYRWKTAVANHVEKPADEHHELKIGKVFAVDADSQDASRWQSEYESRCLELRKKQAQLAGHVAGKATQTRPNVPRNFAWEEMQNEVPKAYKANHAPRDHFGTEYNDKFLAWQGSQPAAAFKPAEEKHLNLFDNTSCLKQEEPLQSEYGANFHGAPSNAGQTLKGKTKSAEVIPPQFAWPMDEIAPKPSAKSLKISDAPLEKTEYESKFAWPPQPPASPQTTRSKPVKESSVAPMAMDADQTSAAWKSEYDDRVEKTIKPIGKAPSAAGIVTVNVDDMPAFFAWADKEEKKTTAPPRVPFPAEVVHSEYKDEFKAYKAEVPKKHVEQDKLNLFDATPASTAEADSAPKDTEYASNYKWTAPSTPNSTGAAGRFHHKDSNLPAQFAWALVDGDRQQKRPKSAPPRAGIPFSEVSEYERSFRWTASDYHRPGVVKNPQADHFQSAATLKFDAEDDTTAKWNSEYDDRCNQLRKRQQEMAIQEQEKQNVTPVAGVQKKAGEDSTPAFFAWSAMETLKEKPVTPKQSIPTESSEYSDRFKKPAVTKDNKAATAAETRSKALHSNHISTSGKKFEGKSEYDDQFTADIAAVAPHPHIVTVHEKQEQSLRNTNLDMSHYHEDQDKIQRRLSSSGPKHQGNHGFATEYSDHFHWPEGSMVVSKSTPLLSTQKTTKSSVLPLHVASALETAKSAFPAKSTTPLTETQSSYVWPDASKLISKPASPTKSPNRKVLQTAQKKYSTMSKSPAANVYRRGNVYKTTFSRSQQVQAPTRPSTATSSPSTPPRNDKKQPRSVERDADSFDAQTYHSDPFTQTAATVMSQDSLNNAASTQTAGRTFATDRTISSSSSHPHTRVSNKKTDYSEASSPVSIADSVSMDSLGKSHISSDIGRREIFQAPSSPLSRSEEFQYRARSAPPRRLVGGLAHTDSNIKYRVYVDESPSNPVLLNRRYPTVSDRQTTRWSTETSDSYRWRPAAGTSPPRLR